MRWTSVSCFGWLAAVSVEHVSLDYDDEPQAGEKPSQSDEDDDEGMSQGRNSGPVPPQAGDKSDTADHLAAFKKQSRELLR